MPSSNAIIDSRAVEPFFKNGYIVACPQTRQGVYLDPGDEVHLVMGRLRELEIDLAAVLLTHAHVDHVSGLGELRGRYPAPIYLHPDDRDLYEDLPFQASWFGIHCQEPPPVDHWLSEGQEIEVGTLRFKVLHTPGHAPGHVIFVLNRNVFCGDTVFAGSIGRTDLPGASYPQLMESIVERILPLGDDKILYPGHGPQTTIARERSSNPFLISAAYTVGGRSQ